MVNFCWHHLRTVPETKLVSRLLENVAHSIRKEKPQKFIATVNVSIFILQPCAIEILANRHLEIQQLITFVSFLMSEFYVFTIKCRTFLSHCRYNLRRPWYEEWRAVLGCLETGAPTARSPKFQRHLRRAFLRISVKWPGIQSLQGCDPKSRHSPALHLGGNVRHSLVHLRTKESCREGHQCQFRQSQKYRCRVAVERKFRTSTFQFKLGLQHSPRWSLHGHGQQSQQSASPQDSL